MIEPTACPLLMVIDFLTLFGGKIVPVGCFRDFYLDNYTVDCHATSHFDVSFDGFLQLIYELPEKRLVS
jgi:hypothetical protein